MTTSPTTMDCLTQVSETVILHCTCSHCWTINTRDLTLLYKVSYLHSEVNKRSLYLLLFPNVNNFLVPVFEAGPRPLGICRISKNKPADQPAKRATPYRIHVLPLLNHCAWKQLIFYKSMYMQGALCRVIERIMQLKCKFFWS